MLVVTYDDSKLYLLDAALDIMEGGGG